LSGEDKEAGTNSMPKDKPTRLPAIDPMTAKAAALFELIARATTKIIPTRGDPMKKT
jgi:hypothetical protein